MLWKLNSVHLKTSYKMLLDDAQSAVLRMWMSCKSSVRKNSSWMCRSKLQEQEVLASGYRCQRSLNQLLKHCFAYFFHHHSICLMADCDFLCFLEIFLINICLRTKQAPLPFLDYCDSKEKCDYSQVNSEICFYDFWFLILLVNNGQMIMTIMDTEWQ